jgi:FkbM family methyltransferase
MTSTLSRIIAHPANQGRVLPAVARYLSWQLAKRTYASHWDIPYHGLTLRCHHDSHSASAALYFNSMPDFREMSFIKKYLRPGDTFLDVGANVGVYTLLAASLVGPDGTVHAFEPGSKALGYLYENISLNKLSNVHVHELALSDRAGDAQLVAGGDDCVASLVAEAGDTPASGATKITCVTLDDYLRDATFAMAKLDIEGAEPMALRGAVQHLQRGNPPVLQIEMDGYSKKYGVETHDFVAELAGLGYDVGMYDSTRNTIEFTNEPWTHGALNVIAVKRNSQAFVLERLRAHPSNVR